MSTVQHPHRWRVIVRRNLWLGIGLLAVGLLMWGRLRMREIPRTAIANDPEPVAAAIEAPPPPIADLTADQATVTEVNPPAPEPDEGPAPPSRP